jgi:hypothetical protein
MAHGVKLHTRFDGIALNLMLNPDAQVLCPLVI